MKELSGVSDISMSLFLNCQKGMLHLGSEHLFI